MLAIKVHPNETRHYASHEGVASFACAWRPHTMSPRLYAGIDPGISGAMGLVREDGRFAAVLDMPTQPTTTGRRQVDFAALAAMLRDAGPCPLSG